MRTKSRVQFIAEWGNWSTSSKQEATITGRIEKFIIEHNLCYGDMPVKVSVRNVETNQTVVIDLNPVDTAKTYADLLVAAQKQVGA